MMGSGSIPHTPTNFNYKNMKSKFSSNFNIMFKFYFDVYRSGIITFCGVKIPIVFNKNGLDSKNVFLKYENGYYKEQIIETKHFNILKAVLIGKKGWGLWVKLWTEGIVEGTFTHNEILQEFKSKNIIIPPQLLKEWDNLIIKKLKK